MKEWLYLVVDRIAYIHDRILNLNDGISSILSDKQLHFLVIGILGMILFFFFHLIFSFLIKRGHIIIISWFYVLTVILVITFAIEIGQKITNTGSMEFADIVSGIFGFLFMFSVFSVIRALFLFLKKIYTRIHFKTHQERKSN